MSIRYDSGCLLQSIYMILLLVRFLFRMLSIDQVTVREAEAIEMASRKAHGRVGPYSRVLDRGAVGTMLDGRSREGRFMRAYERTLEQHIGGAPSAVQRALISQAARLALRIELMDERSLTSPELMSERDGREYRAWSGSLARILVLLGVRDTPARQPSITELLAAGRPA